VLSQMSEEKQTAFQFLSVLFKAINHANYIASVTDKRMSRKYWWNYIVKGILKYSKKHLSQC
jgi:hypothetical protein